MGRHEHGSPSAMAVQQLSHGIQVRGAGVGENALRATHAVHWGAPMHGPHPVRRARAVARRLGVVPMSIRRCITPGAPPECLVMLVLLLLVCVVLRGVLLVVRPGGSCPHAPRAPLTLHATHMHPRMGR